MPPAMKGAGFPLVEPQDDDQEERGVAAGLSHGCLELLSSCPHSREKRPPEKVGFEGPLVPPTRRQVHLSFLLTTSPSATPHVHQRLGGETKQTLEEDR